VALAAVAERARVGACCGDRGGDLRPGESPGRPGDPCDARRDPAGLAGRGRLHAGPGRSVAETDRASLPGPGGRRLPEHDRGGPAADGNKLGAEAVPRLGGPVSRLRERAVGKDLARAQEKPALHARLQGDGRGGPGGVCMDELDPDRCRAGQAASPGQVLDTALRRGGSPDRRSGGDPPSGGEFRPREELLRPQVGSRQERTREQRGLLLLGGGIRAGQPGRRVRGRQGGVRVP